MKHVASRVGIFGAFLTLSFSVFAQVNAWPPQPVKETTAEKKREENKEIKPPAPGQVAKKIVVTGSYIRRAADEGAPSPVTTVDNTKAQEAGTYSAGGMMADNAVISSGTSSNVSFHGQSAANNLVLLNGLRIPKAGGGDAASIDFIPASAIERVEILKDGASALYGSEALAGVVNIITKKEYDGANISVRHARPEDSGFNGSAGSETNLTATYGKNIKSGNILAVFQYRGNEPIWNSETPYGIQDVLARGSEASNPGNLQKTNNPKANYHGSECPQGLVDGTNLCRYDYVSRDQFSNDRKYYNALLSGGFDLGNDIRLETAIVYTRQESIGHSSPVYYKFSDQSANGGPNFALPGSNANVQSWAPFLTGPGGAPVTINPGDSFTLAYSPDQELGDRVYERTTDSGAAQVSLGKQTDDLDWQISVGYSATYDLNTNTRGNAKRDMVYQHLLSDWNPFLPVASKDVNILNDSRIETWNQDFADVLNSRFILSGKEIDWGPKSIYAAVGIEHQLQSYRFRVDNNTLNDNTLLGSGSNQDGSRNVVSSFIELTQNPIPDLQIQLAGRIDAYSDFGTTINPKIAAGYKFNDQAMMRASYGTGFKAPDLRALYQGRLTRPQRIRDEVSCRDPLKGPNHPDCNRLIQATNAGDPTLDPELGRHLNVGLQLRPSPRWQINIDHWRASGTEAITEIGSNLLSRMTQIEADGGIAQVNQLGVTIVRDPIDGSVLGIEYPLKTNSGSYKTNGIDLDVRYKNQVNPLGLGTMNFSFRFDHSHTLNRESQTFFFLPTQEQFDPDWKNITSFSLSKGSHLGSWRVRTFSSGDKDRSQAASSIGIGSIPTITEHDIHYEYYAAWEGVFTFGVRNVFDKLYFNEYSRGQDGFLYSASPTALGRTFYLGYSQDF